MLTLEIDVSVPRLLAGIVWKTDKKILMKDFVP